jgi:hypothetical protein
MLPEIYQRRKHIWLYFTYAQADQLLELRAGRAFPGRPKSWRVMVARGLATGDPTNPKLTVAGRAAADLVYLLDIPDALKTRSSES